MTVYRLTPRLSRRTGSTLTQVADGNVIASMTVTHGRTDTSSQPGPPTASVTLLRDGLDLADFPLGQEMDVHGTLTQPPSTTGTARTLLRGRITDMSVGRETVNLTITGSGLGSLNQQTLQSATFQGGSRIDTNIGIAYTLFTGSALTVYGAGSVSLASTTHAAGSRGLETLQGIAQQEPGSVLAETVDGVPYWTSARWRRTNANTAPQRTLNGGAILSEFTASRSLADRVNRARVQWVSGTATAAALADVAAYGIFDAEVSTNLSTAADAALIARQLVAFGTDVKWRLDTITIDFERWDSGTDASAWTASPLIGETFALDQKPWAELADLYYLEGWTWQFNGSSALLSLNLSDPTLSRWPQQWSDVPTATKWNSSAIAGVTWNDLIKVDI